MSENVVIKISMLTPPQGVEWVCANFAALAKGFKCEIAIYEIGDRIEMAADFGTDVGEAARFAAMMHNLTGVTPILCSPEVVN
jgi:hypothetical protein